MYIKKIGREKRQR